MLDPENFWKCISISNMCLSFQYLHEVLQYFKSDDDYDECLYDGSAVCSPSGICVSGTPRWWKMVMSSLPSGSLWRSSQLPTTVESSTTLVAWWAWMKPWCAPFRYDDIMLNAKHGYNLWLHLRSPVRNHSKNQNVFSSIHSVLFIPV